MALDLQGRDRSGQSQTELSGPSREPASSPGFAGEDQPSADAIENSARARARKPQGPVPAGGRVVELPPPREDRPLDRGGEGADRPRKGRLRRHPIAAVIGVVLSIALAAVGYLYWDYAQHFETTDDAFIAARQFAIAPKVSGYITSVPVTDNQHVAAGAVIARIDQRDYRNALAQAEAQVAAAEAGIENSDAQISVQQAQISANQAQVRQAQAALVFAQQQSTRYKDLAGQGYGTVQNSQQWSSQLRQDSAGLARDRKSVV